MKEQLNELALFAGAGGGILGGKLLGWRTVCAVEWDAYARDVLVARQNDGCLEAFPIWDDVQTFDGHPWRGIVDVVSGGFPCQDISCAGKGAGIEGERSSMWKHMARVIGEVRPRYAFVENSPMLVGRGLSTVLADLAEMGYDAKWGIVGAHHVAAPHKRDRIWILATDSTQLQCDGINDNTGKLLESQSISKLGNNSWQNNVSNANVCGCDNGCNTERQYETDNTQIGETEKDKQSRSIWQHRTSEDCGDLSYADLSHGKGNGLSIGSESEYAELNSCCSWWRQDPAEAPESNVGRMADGVASRVDRLKAIGNGQVPAVAQLAWSILKS